jgi:hypothetical protein
MWEPMASARVRSLIRPAKACEVDEQNVGEVQHQPPRLVAGEDGAALFDQF